MSAQQKTSPLRKISPEDRLEVEELRRQEDLR
jgi:hypothetical protein